MEPILWDTTTPLPHLKARWLPSLHTYLRTTGLHLQLSYTGVYPPHHVNNERIMTTVIESNAFKPHKIK
eukprot:1218834-Ditylum_brightwellii.AAC.1